MELFFADKETLKMVVALFGEDAVRVAEVLESVDETTDIQITDQTEIRLNTVRKTLYRLYDHSLVGLRRTRDKETGWFVFHWRLQPDQLEGFIFNQKRRVLENWKLGLGMRKATSFTAAKRPVASDFPSRKHLSFSSSAPHATGQWCTSRIAISLKP